MTASTTPPAVIGFLTAIEQPPHGLFGGYLLLNMAGRPLEFHCTMPVIPNRAQQILYGPTLEPFLYGEQIGATLVNKSAIAPLAVLVDLSAMLAVRPQINIPTALVSAETNSPTLAPANLAVAIPRSTQATELSLGKNRLIVPNRYAADCELIHERLSKIEELFDLVEPFQRIRDAIEEANRSTAKAA